jgi:YidC/Oxa1 family membrane protein insertase
VKLVSNGLIWTSSNPQVEECLANLKAVAEKNWVYSAKTSQLSCSVEYRLDENKKELLKASLDISGIKDTQGQLFLSLVDDLGKGTALEKKTLDFKIDDKVKHLKEKDLYAASNYQGKKEWIIWGDKYFAVGFFPVGKFNPDLSHEQKGNNTVGLKLSYPLIAAEGTQSQKYEIDLYFGTKEISTLKSIRSDLVEAVDMGFFAPIGRFMLFCLKLLNKVFQNYGFSIIALTLFVRLLFWPLNKKVFESGNKMKALQPKMEAIKKKYGDDRSKMEQMNREIMNLYRENKVNPMGSCLPMLLQLPIFLGLYGALNHAVDLYQAPFMLWIHDLSSRDYYYVLPVLWTLSLLITMKVTPQPTNNQPGMPDMKKIMFVMYIVFGFLSKDWPAGLLLYLVVSGFVGIAQQFVFSKNQVKVERLQEGVN